MDASDQRRLLPDPISVAVALRPSEVSIRVPKGEVSGSAHQRSMPSTFGWSELILTQTFRRLGSFPKKFPSQTR